MKSRWVKLALFSVISILGCVGGPGSQLFYPSASLDRPVTMGLAVQKGTFSATPQKHRSSLTSRNIRKEIAQKTSQSIEALPSETYDSLRDALKTAALLEKDTLLFLQIPARSESSWIYASIHSITDQEFIEDTSIEFQKAEQFFDDLARWLRTIRPAIVKIKPFQAVEYVQNLERKQHCQEVADFVTLFEARDVKQSEALQNVLRFCNRALVRGMEIPPSYRLRVNQKGLSPQMLSKLDSSLSNAQVRKAAFQTSPFLADLHLRCENACKNLHLILDLEFDEERYLQNVSDPENPEEAFAHLGETLLGLRENLKAALPLRNDTMDESTIIRLHLGGGHNLDLRVKGDVNSPKVLESTEFRDFIRPSLVGFTKTQGRPPSHL